MTARLTSLVVLVLALLVSSSCVATQSRFRSSTLEFLYPAGTAARAAADVRLEVPVRVGIAFAPDPNPWQSRFGEDRKQALLRTVADAMADRDGLAPPQVIPSTYLEPGGGFGNLERIREAFGVDVVTLLSYDQIQFSDTTKRSWAYWTLIGAYVVKGEKNETRTVLDASVIDVASRALLFTASGQSTVGGRATPIELSRTVREQGELGFEQAVDDLVADLRVALDAFEEQAASGSVRGRGTPAVALVDAAGAPVAVGGGGGVGLLEPLALLALLALATGARRAA